LNKFNYTLEEMRVKDRESFATKRENWTCVNSYKI